jgi:peptidyl-prolyl cis-trans isomerase C
MSDRAPPINLSETPNMLRFLAFSAAVLMSTAVLAQNIATVNNKPIPKSKEDAWVKVLVDQGQKDSPELRQRIKDELVQREVLMQEAVKRGIPDRPDVKFQIDAQRQNVIAGALVRDEMTKHPITDDQVKAEYDKQKSKVGGTEYHARHILVEKEDEAKAIIDQLNKGAKFEDLAKKSKDPGSAERGGDLGWNVPDGFVKPFSDAMVKLQKGKYTDKPVQSQFGWHVIKLEDTRPVEFPPMEKVAPQIRESLQQQKIQAFIADLKSKAKIQ